MGARVSFPDDRGVSDRVRADRRFRPLTDTAMAVLVGVSVVLTALSLSWVGVSIKKLHEVISAGAAQVFHANQVQ